MNKELITNPIEGKAFLRLKLAYLMSELQTDTFTRKVYEIETPAGIEVWIERESRLEEPEYFYRLRQYQGDMEAKPSINS